MKRSSAVLEAQGDRRTDKNLIAPAAGVFIFYGVGA